MKKIYITLLMFLISASTFLNAQENVSGIEDYAVYRLKVGGQYVTYQLSPDEGSTNNVLIEDARDGSNNLAQYFILRSDNGIIYAFSAVDPSMAIVYKRDDFVSLEKYSEEEKAKFGLEFTFDGGNTFNIFSPEDRSNYFGRTGLNGLKVVRSDQVTQSDKTNFVLEKATLPKL
ncbi:MAG: hypothetical protein ACEPOV_04160 [Hyphomicrobiales bacterium]